MTSSDILLQELTPTFNVLSEVKRESIGFAVIAISPILLPEGKNPGGPSPKYASGIIYVSALYLFFLISSNITSLSFSVSIYGCILIIFIDSVNLFRCSLRCNT